MSGPFITAAPDRAVCDRCGSEMNVHERSDGSREEWCPVCDQIDVPDLNVADAEYECSGCEEIKSNCVAHHASYDPERVVPMCTHCHARLHANDDYLPDLTPDLSRTEAEERNLVTVIGLDDGFAID